MLAFLFCSSLVAIRPQALADDNLRASNRLSNFEIYELLHLAQLPRINFAKEPLADALKFLEGRIKDVCIQSNHEVIQVVIDKSLSEKISKSLVTAKFDNISILEILLYLSRKSDVKFKVGENSIVFD